MLLVLGWLMLVGGHVCAESILNKLTIVIKTHERPQSVKQLVQSVRQFYPSIRVIVADDGQLSPKFNPK